MTPESGRVLAVITARGGSKGLPRKNVLPLADRPLIGWTIAAARGAACVGRVVVSTDDDEIAQVAQTQGAEVPFMRPADLATDSATSVDVLRHALQACPGHEYVVLLQPTSPLRLADDIDAAYTHMQGLGAPSCVSICEVDESPWLMYGQTEDGRLSRLLPEPPRGYRRQDLPAAYRLNGAIYIARVDWFLAGGSLIGPATVGYRMPADRSVDIDTQADFDHAASLLTRRASAP